MDFADPIVGFLYEYGRSDLVARVQGSEFALILHGKLHHHRLHPTLNFLVPDTYCTLRGIEFDDSPVPLVALYRPSEVF